MKYKYIPILPKPLLNDFTNNRVIPFVGAGFSKNANIPNGQEMPDWYELGKIAANEIKDYKYENNPIDALSFYEELYSRPKLVELIMKSLHYGDVTPSDTYKSFCELFTGIICTTNFDSLLEDTMTILGRSPSVIVTEDRLTIKNRKEISIIKVHGDYNHPNKMIITERDYDLYINNNPIFATYIANLFINNTMLLIGYSLDDTDFRSIWQIINNRLGNMAQPAYCIAVDASPELVAKYKRRNVRVINLPGSAKNYSIILKDLFDELKQYADDQRNSNAKSSNERINEQMVIPAEDNRLCFISCELSRISRLSELINPILLENGITPVKPDDLLMPSDNIIDILNTAIRKSKAAIVDISDVQVNGLQELNFIMKIKEDRNILFICEKNTDIPSLLSNKKVLTYSFDDFGDSYYHFNNSINNWLKETFNIDNYNINDLFTDANRLLKKKEYSAAIVSAYSELEYIISQYADPNQHNRVSYLMKKYADNSTTINDAIILRNQIVHKKYTAKKSEAERIVDYLKAIGQRVINK